ncbi:MAG: hypothetical protein JHC95_03725 [Solirubrobacteraceae bacterium]|nr:hypothetical protein [Solirubrobacteraceae bacterium]
MIKTSLSVGLAVLALAAPAQAALVGTPLVQLPQPTDVAALDGMLAYTEPDPAGGQRIMLRDGQGTRPLGVISQVRPFTLGMGRATGGTAPALVYPRCTPTSAICRLAVTPVATGAERIVPGTLGAVRGAVAGTRVLAVVERSDGVQRLLSIQAGRTQTLRIPRRPDDWASTPNRRVFVPRRNLKITDIDAQGDTVLYVLTYQIPNEPIAQSELWLQRGSRPPARVARVGTGGGSSGLRSFLGVRLLPDGIVAYRQGRDQGSALVRLSLRGAGRGEAGLGQTDDEDIVAGAFDRGGFLYVARPYANLDDCRSGSPDEPGPGTCTLYDSGPMVFKR